MPGRRTNVISESDSRRTLTVLTLLWLSAATGCAATVDRPAANVRPAVGKVSAETLQNLLNKREKQLSSLDAIGKLRLDNDLTGDRFRAAQAILAQRPSSFRIEILGPFGVRYAVASDGDSLAVLASDESTVYRGAATRETIASAIGVAASSAEITYLLLGHPPVHAANLRSTWTSRPIASGESQNPAAEELFLHAADDGPGSVVIGFGRIRLGRDLVALPLSFQRIARNGDRLLAASFSDFTRKDSLVIAREIVIKAGKSVARIQYREVEPSKELPSSAFHLKTPEGLQVGEFPIPSQ